jgi:hypothetical protein
MPVSTRSQSAPLPQDSSTITERDEEELSTEVTSSTEDPITTSYLLGILIQVISERILARAALGKIKSAVETDGERNLWINALEQLDGLSLDELETFTSTDPLITQVVRQRSVDDWITLRSRFFNPEGNRHEDGREESPVVPESPIATPAVGKTTVITPSSNAIPARTKRPRTKSVGASSSSERADDELDRGVTTDEGSKSPPPPKVKRGEVISTSAKARADAAASRRFAHVDDELPESGTASATTSAKQPSSSSLADASAPLSVRAQALAQISANDTRPDYVVDKGLTRVVAITREMESVYTERSAAPHSDKGNLNVLLSGEASNLPKSVRKDILLGNYFDCDQINASTGGHQLGTVAVLPGLFVEETAPSTKCQNFSIYYDCLRRGLEYRIGKFAHEKDAIRLYLVHIHHHSIYTPELFEQFVLFDKHFRKAIQAKELGYDFGSFRLEATFMSVILARNAPSVPAPIATSSSNSSGRSASKKSSSGKDPCRRYNSGQQHNDNCQFSHVCSDCGGRHPSSACSRGGGRNERGNDGGGNAGRNGGGNATLRAAAANIRGNDVAPRR